MENERSFLMETTLSERKINPEKKMERVLKTALKLFVEKGYHNVSIPTIVKESGVSTGSIYNYFKNKEALGLAIYTQTQDNFNSVFNERLKNKEKTYDKLRVFAELVFEITEQDRIVMEYMLFVRHTEFLKDSAPICYSEPFKILRDILHAGMETQEIKQQDVFVAGISFTGIILRAVELRISGVYRHNLINSIDNFMENAWNAVKNNKRCSNF